MKTRIALNGNDGNWRIGIGETALWESYESFDPEQLEDFLKEHAGRTTFVLLSYELRKQWYAAGNPGKEAFPLVRIWVPESCYTVVNGKLQLTEGALLHDNELLAAECLAEQQLPVPPVSWKPRQSKSDYLEQIRFLKQQIQLGNLYEVNYCQEFFAEEVEWNSILPVYSALNRISTAPYSLFYESADWMIASASPERFLQKKGERLISQPIKGTAGRGAMPGKDDELKEQLAVSHKDRTENVMIVDLVRNDLSRVATKASVQVDELFGIYTFPTVHQMISTVSCRLKEDVRFTDILEAAFPMGSMTGAPKVAAMQLAEATERFTRGMYSGSAGYIGPDGDFDLNVMIRSFVYNVANRYVSCGVGGAITILSDPEEEYAECRTKVGRILETVGTCQW
jgi:para-aminobenzoate synthetase component I